MISIMPKTESIDGLNAIMDEADGGMIMPTYVVIELKESAMKDKGTITLYEGTVSETKIPYLMWTDTALATTVPAIMKISNEIGTKYGDVTDDKGVVTKEGIVSTVSGINSWQVLYTQVEQQYAAKGVTATPTMINTILESQMPSAVKSYITTMMNIPLTSSATVRDVPYSQAIGATSTGTAVTVANVIDYILNCGTGILSDKGNYVNMMVITSEKPMSDNTMTFVRDIRNDFHGENGYDTTYSVLMNKTYVAGTSAVMEDVSNDVISQFNFIRVVVIVALIVLLFLILGSYLTPIRSMLTIVASIMTTVGLTHFVFGNLLNIPVLWLVPIVLFVVLLGLGMDYDIFLTTRIRENKLRGMDNHDAIEDAVKKAGPVTSLCSLIMGGTFLTMLFTSSSMLQEFGFALGVGILIEGLLMVGFMVPALMHLMGDLSWIGPKFLNRTKVE